MQPHRRRHRPAGLVWVSNGDWLGHVADERGAIRRLDRARASRAVAWGLLNAASSRPQQRAAGYDICERRKPSECPAGSMSSPIGACGSPWDVAHGAFGPTRWSSCPHLLACWPAGRINPCVVASSRRESSPIFSSISDGRPALDHRSLARSRSELPRPWTIPEIDLAFGEASSWFSFFVVGKSSVTCCRQ